MGPHCGVPADLANGLSATDDPAARSDPEVAAEARSLAQALASLCSHNGAALLPEAVRRCGAQDALLRSFLGGWRGALGDGAAPLSDVEACVEELANADLTPVALTLSAPLNLPGGGADSDSDSATSEDEDCGGEDEGGSVKGGSAEDASGSRRRLPTAVSKPKRSRSIRCPTRRSRRSGRGSPTSRPRSNHPPREASRRASGVRYTSSTSSLPRNRARPSSFPTPRRSSPRTRRRRRRRRRRLAGAGSPPAPVNPGEGSRARSRATGATPGPSTCATTRKRTRRAWPSSWARRCGSCRSRNRRKSSSGRIPTRREDPKTDPRGT